MEHRFSQPTSMSPAHDHALVDEELHPDPDPLDALFWHLEPEQWPQLRPEYEQLASRAREAD